MDVSSVFSVLSVQWPGIILFPNLYHLTLLSFPMLSKSLLFPALLCYLKLVFGFPGMMNEPGCCGEVWLSTAACQVPALDHLDLAGCLPHTSLLLITEHKNRHVVDLSHVDLNAGDGPIYGHLLTALSSLKQIVTLHFPHIGIADTNMPSCKGFECLEHLQSIFALPRVLVMFFNCLLTPNLCKVTLSQSTRI